MASSELKPDIDIRIDDTLRLHPLGPNDAQALYESVDSNREHLSEYSQHTVDACGTLEDAEKYINFSDSSSLRLGIWVCQAAGVEKLAGAISATFDEENKQIEIGYWLDANHIGNGYARMAVAALARYLSREYSGYSIIAKVVKGNEPSMRVLEKAGFVRNDEPVEELRKGATDGANVTKFVYEYKPTSNIPNE